jgi:uncharacterized protein YdcH (DUF465 family)
MNRHWKRLINKHNKLITRIARKETMAQLKEREIDFTIENDTIISLRQKEVSNVYDTAMVNAVRVFVNCNGNIGLVKKLYNIE